MKALSQKNNRITLINEPISTLRNESIRTNQIESHTRIAQRMAQNTHSATRDKYSTEIATDEILETSKHEEVKKGKNTIREML
jgi:hypothetical protein